MPFPPTRDLPGPRIEPVSPVSPALAGRFFTTEQPGKPAVFIAGARHGEWAAQNQIPDGFQGEGFKSSVTGSAAE